MILTIAHNYMVDARKCHSGALWNDGLRGKSGLLTATDAWTCEALHRGSQCKTFVLVGHIFGITWMFSDISLRK